MPDIAGSSVLVDLLFPFAIALVGLGVLGGFYLVTAGRQRFGLAVGITVSLVLIALGLANGYLWTLCISAI